MTSSQRSILRLYQSQNSLKKCLNPLQVQTKLRPVHTARLLLGWFQSPIGTNKTHTKSFEDFVWWLFQSPIGTNKTIMRAFEVKDGESFNPLQVQTKLLMNCFVQIAMLFVSIPYRYKQNRLERTVLLFVNAVSIPYRYKQNSRIDGKSTKQNTFQSPIGTNKTNKRGGSPSKGTFRLNPLQVQTKLIVVSIAVYDALKQFQSPIGTNKTRRI